MRIAFLSIGRHIHTERWIRWFAQRGHDCHLLTVQPGPVDGVTVHDIRAGFGPKPLRYAFALRRVKQILHQLKPDLLNTHFLTGYGYWGHYSGFHPNVLTVWGDDVYVTPFENRLKNRLARAALRSCDALTGDSADILQVSCELGATPDRSFRVLWGVDFDRFSPGNAEGWRRGLGFEPEHTVYFSPRSYTQPYYNIDIVIAAAARLKNENPQARFLFAGYEGDPAPFEAMAEEAGILSVSRVIGRIPHDDFATALQACDVFISVPSVDATAVSLLEAMSCGCGIIVSSLPSAMEWIQDGVSGMIVQPRDTGALVQAMRKLGEDAAFRKRAGQAARITAHDHAGFETNMEYVDRVFAGVLGNGPFPDEVSLARLVRGSGDGVP